MKGKSKWIKTDFCFLLICAGMCILDGNWLQILMIIAFSYK